MFSEIICIPSFKTSNSNRVGPDLYHSLWKSRSLKYRFYGVNIFLKAVVSKLIRRPNALMANLLGERRDLWRRMTWTPQFSSPVCRGLQSLARRSPSGLGKIRLSRHLRMTQEGSLRTSKRSLWYLLHLRCSLLMTIGARKVPVSTSVASVGYSR